MENKNIFKKLEQRFLIESTKIENASFLHETPVSEANIKAIEWLVQNLKERKNRAFPVTTLFGFKKIVKLLL